MAKPATLVKDGIAYNYRGERIAPVVARDGYYQDVIPDIGLKNGEWLTGVPVPKLESRLDDELLIECYTLSDYPALTRANGNGHVDGGRISPVLPVGTLVYIFNIYRVSFYYIPPERQIGNLAELLSRWWLRFPFESPWEISGGKTRLSKSRYAWARSHGCPPMEHIVFQAYRDFMTQPIELSMSVSALVTRQLGFIKYKLNRQISPIGGVVNRILPTWQKGIALCHVWFTINDIDPTNGAGCGVYKNGDFYYGPWCQRVRQKSADKGIMLLHDFPPKYNLRSWIAGPLFATAQEKGNNKGNNGFPKKFKPTGATTLLAGTDYSDKSDVPEHPLPATAKEMGRAVELAGKQIHAEFMDELWEALSHPTIESFENPGDIILRIPVDNGSYLRSNDAQFWKYCVPVIGEDLQSYELSIEVTDGEWGVDDNERGNYRNTMPGLNCGCGTCKKIRRRVEECLKTKKIPETEI